MSQFGLLGERRFGPFFGTQFLGAFNDNVFKNALVITIAYEATRDDASFLVNVSAGLFILPFFLFSALAGQLADRTEKSVLMRRIKLAEVGIMLLAATGFLLGSVTFLIAVLFLMGTQSAFFGPVKYAILPQHLAEEELVGGNALVESGTFLAILLGTLLGGLLVAGDSRSPLAIGGVLVAVAALGWLASRAIPAAPASQPGLRLDWNVPVATWRIVRQAAGNRTVFLSILGISWFWLYGAMFLTQLPVYTREVLGGSETVVTLLLVTFSVGIGVGSLACEKLSGRLVEIGLVPFGSIGLTVFAVDLAFASPSLPPAEVLSAGEFLRHPGYWRVLVDLAGAALFGGFYIVPLYALVQSRSEPEHRARIIAANNILNALFMVVSALMAIGLLAAGLRVPDLFLVMGLLNAAVAVYIYGLVPEFLLRFIVWMLIHTVYRLDVRGIDHLPDEGAAVVACNHVSFVDALILTAASRRPIRFIMDHRIYRSPLLGYVFRTARAIPIAPAKDDPEMMRRALDQAAEALENGELVGIFPEGRITSDGEMKEFRGGIERMVKRTPAPVVPMALSGLWGSFFSRRGGSAMSKPLRLLTRFRSRIGLAVGEPVPPDRLHADELRRTVLALRGERR